jgi:hypothetical protein
VPRLPYRAIRRAVPTLNRRRLARLRATPRQSAEATPAHEAQQPDGIEEDGRELPDPRRAAERVRAYIEMAGDGLYDVAGAKPLFGRDLEALTRALLADSTPTERAPLVVTLAVSDVL